MTPPARPERADCSPPPLRGRSPRSAAERRVGGKRYGVSMRHPPPGSLREPTSPSRGEVNRQPDRRRSTQLSRGRGLLAVLCLALVAGCARPPGPVEPAVRAEPVGAVAPAAEQEPKPRKPNGLLILVDDLGYADLGCYGSKDIRTPNIDKLAKDGVRLTDSYAAAAICSPTRAALITGRYPQRSGFEWVIRYTEKNVGLPATEASLPRLLKKAGYATALYGKWHLGYRPEFGPNAHGFDEFFGFLAADLDYYSHRDANGDPGLYENTKLVDQKGYLTDLITERSLAFLKKHAAEPFFPEVAYNAPHWPFQVPGKPDDIRNLQTYGPEDGTRAEHVNMVEHLDA